MPRDNASSHSYDLTPPHLRDHYPLREIVSLQTGGVAHYYSPCTTIPQIITTLQESIERSMPYRVLGHGTSVLISDTGVPGIVIHNQTKDITFLHDRSQVIVDAGVPLATLVAHTLSHGYSGLEFLHGSTGTLGGAVYRNMQRWGVSIGNYVKGATICLPWLSKEQRIRRVEADWFQFSADGSKLKAMSNEGNTDRPVILSLTLQLSRMDHETCLRKLKLYQQWQKAFPQPSGHALQVFDSVTLHSQSDLPHLRRRPDRVVFPIARLVVKNLHVQSLRVSQENPNFIINEGLATSQDAWSLIEMMQEQLDRNGVRPVPIIEKVGAWY